MPVVSVRIPQLGEGLQEARLIEFLKQPGDTIRRDDEIYVMETDKATTEVESPYDGKLVEWLVEPDSILPIGTEIAKMEVAEGVKEMPADHHPPGSSAAPTAAKTRRDPVSPASPRMPVQPVPAAPEFQPVAAPPASAIIEPPANRRGPVRAAGNIPVPPRTKRYLKEKGLLEFTYQIQAAGTKLMPDDVDKFLAEGGPKEEPKTKRAKNYDETVLPSAQQTLNYRMARGAQIALPAVLETTVDWRAISAARDVAREHNGPTGFAMLLWCVADSMKEHAAFRSTLSTDGKTLRTYHHVNLGVAVSLPGDRLVTAVVRDADTLSPTEFFEALSERISEARDGKDQVDGTTTVSVSNIGTAGMRSGIPVVVTPAVATIAIGEIRDQPVPTEDGFTFQKVASLTMSFDHRLMNGVGAANFLNSVRERAATFVLPQAVSN